MKKKNGLVIGVVVLIALCLVYIGVGLYLDHSEEKKVQQAEAEKVYMTDFSSVISISYNKDETELSFTKDGDTWSYDGDSQFPVLQSKLTSMADTVTKLEAIRKLDGGDEMSAYGLDAPARKITVTAEDGTKSVLSLGNKTEDGDYYASIEGEASPYLISSTLFNETSYGLDELIAMEEFPAIAGTDIQSITIKKDGVSEYYRKKTADDEAGTISWYRDSTDSEDNRISGNSGLNVLADSLSSLVVKSCANYKVTEEEMDGYGLKDPSIILSYTYDKNGTEETFTLSVGNLTEDGSNYYTWTEGSKNINEIDKASIDKCLTVNTGVEGE